MSSGEYVQVVKTPCAFNKTGFLNFLKFEKPHPAGRKDFFDTLVFPPAGGKVKLKSSKFRDMRLEF